MGGYLTNSCQVQNCLLLCVAPFSFPTYATFPYVLSVLPFARSYNNCEGYCDDLLYEADVTLVCLKYAMSGLY